MPEDDGSFGNRPFRELQFHDSRSRSGKRGLDPEDRELFLRACANMRADPAKTEKGFKLGDICSLPGNIVEKKKKKRKRAAENVDKYRKPEQTTAAEDIFAAAMRGTMPLSGKGRRVARRKERVKLSEIAEPQLMDYLADGMQFAVSFSEEYLEGYAVGTDELVMNRLRQGHFSHEAHLDMHGLNAEQAFETLREFMRQTWHRGLRNVLIVTGRGRNSPAGLAILRHKLPYWLTHEPFKRIVQAFCTAQPHDGGPGSIYVLLRRNRKKGPVRWETLAFDSDNF